MHKKIKAILSFFSTILDAFCRCSWSQQKSSVSPPSPPPLSSLRQLELDQILKISFSSLG